MPIQSVGKFMADAEKNILHHKSNALKDVIEKLGQYHENPNPEHLVRLRDSMVTWQEKNQWEFASRGGPGLMGEVLNEVRSIKPAKPSRQKGRPLVNGDILFRWFPRGLKTRFKEAPKGREALQGIISIGQTIQDYVQQLSTIDVYVSPTEFSVNVDSHEGVNVENSAINLQHVAIYFNETVIEIGPTGLERHAVTAREHYDLVVRTRTDGVRIAEKASLARTGSAYSGSFFRNRLNYPVWDLLNVSAIPHRGALSRRPIYEERDFKKYGDNGYVLQQRVICSHFVNAVLYMALRPYGTIAAATSHEYDEIFKVSPTQMWKEFLNRQGIWAETNAFFVGLQHKGEIIDGIKPSSLGVGLP